MIRTIRLNIPADLQRSARQILEDTLAALGLELVNIEVNYREHKTQIFESVIVPVRDCEETRALASRLGPFHYFDGAPDSRLDLPGSILEASDLEPIEIGDNVSGRFYDLGEWIPFSGIVSRKYSEGDRLALIIRAVNPGKNDPRAWKISDGDRAEIRLEKENLE